MVWLNKAENGIRGLETVEIDIYMFNRFFWVNIGGLGEQYQSDTIHNRVDLVNSNGFGRVLPD